MATIKISYDTAASITLTLASLADGAARQATKIDNTSTLYDDIILNFAIKLGAGTAGNLSAINFYLAGSTDGTNFDYPATGSDAAITLTTNSLRFAQVLTISAASTTYPIIIPSVAAYFGGVLPPFIAVIVENKTGITFSSTEGDHTKQYKGIWYTSS